jgi:hypothetical protein
MFRLLGLVPGNDLSIETAAALAHTTTEEARHLLGTLATAHLVEERAPERYASHDLLRRYAAEKARAEETSASRHHGEILACLPLPVAGGGPVAGTRLRSSYLRRYIMRAPPTDHPVPKRHSAEAPGGGVFRASADAETLTSPATSPRERW